MLPCSLVHLQQPYNLNGISSIRRKHRSFKLLLDYESPSGLSVPVGMHAYVSEYAFTEIHWYSKSSRMAGGQADRQAGFWQGPEL